MEGSVNRRVQNINSNREPKQCTRCGMTGHVGRFCRHFLQYSQLGAH